MNIADLRIPCEPPCTEPYARWCGSPGQVTAPGHPIRHPMPRAGLPTADSKRTWIKMDKWQSVTRPVVKFVMNLKWFRRTGLIALDDYTHRNLEFKFAR